MELDRTLPPAPQSLLNFVFTKLVESSVSIPNDDLMFIGRIVTEYLANTGEGKKAILKILDAEVNSVSYLKQYYPAGCLGDADKKLDYRGLVEYRGYVYRGKAISYGAIEVENNPDLEICDGCGGRYPKIYCAQTHRSIINGKEHLENLCNHCRRNHQDIKIKETSNFQTCNECKYMRCSFHPEHHKEMIEQQRTLHGQYGQPKLPITVSNPMERYSTV
jgi:hypothetical protein